MELTGEYEVYFEDAPAGHLAIRRIGLKTQFEFRSDSIFDVSRLVCVSDGKAVSIGIPVPTDSGLYLRRGFSDAAIASMKISEIERCLLVPVDLDLSTLTQEPENTGDTHETTSPTDTGTASGSSGTSDNCAIPDASSNAEPERSDDNRTDADKTAVSAGLENAHSTSGESPVSASLQKGWHEEREPEKLFADPELAASCKNSEGVLTFSDNDITLVAFPYSHDKPFPLEDEFPKSGLETINGSNFIVYRVRDGKII